MTTIKVTADIRDRLKSQASASHRSLGAYLGDLADLADRRARFNDLRRAIAQTPAENLREYQAEAAEWESAELTDATRA